MVTNQSGIARGFFTEAVVERDASRTSRDRSRRAARTSTRITIVRTIRTGASPSTRARCDCRKPGRGLVDRAARELGLDPARSFVVGDRWLDVALGRAVGARGDPGPHRLRRRARSAQPPDGVDGRRGGGQSGGGRELDSAKSEV